MKDEYLLSDWLRERQAMKLQRTAKKSERWHASQPAAAAYHVIGTDDSAVSKYKQYEMKELEEVRRLFKLYYTALSNRDADMMQAVWLPESNTRCVLPGYHTQHGRFSIMTMYREIFGDAFDLKAVEQCNVSISLMGHFAIAIGVEKVKGTADLSQSQVLLSDLGSQSAADYQAKQVRISDPDQVPHLHSTSILRKHPNGRWYLLYHHASPYQPELDTYNRYQDTDEAETPLRIGAKGFILRGKGLLSNDGRITLTGKGGAPLGEAIASAIRAIRESRTLSGRGKASVDGGFDDISEPDSEVAEEDEAARWKKSRPKRSSVASEAMHGPILGGELGRVTIRSTTKRTVHAIRNLNAQGRISDSEKESLLADVINKASVGERSQVEVAYDLIIAHGNQIDYKYYVSGAAMVEFGEHCKVMAQQIHTSHTHVRRESGSGPQSDQ